MSKFITVLDTETTGLSDKSGHPGAHRIIEVAALCFDATTYKTKGKYVERIDPERSISAKSQEIHGISYADLVGKDTWDKVGPRLHKIIRNSSLLVAHNGIFFDFPFIKHEFERIGLTMPEVALYDTMIEGRFATATGKVPSLKELAFACDADYDEGKAHSALYDILVLSDCFFKGVNWGFFKPFSSC